MASHLWHLAQPCSYSEQAGLPVCLCESTCMCMCDCMRVCRWKRKIIKARIWVSLTFSTTSDSAWGSLVGRQTPQLAKGGGHMIPALYFWWRSDIYLPHIYVHSGHNCMCGSDWKVGRSPSFSKKNVVLLGTTLNIAKVVLTDSFTSMHPHWVLQPESSFSAGRGENSTGTRATCLCSDALLSSPV